MQDAATFRPARRIAGIGVSEILHIGAVAAELKRMPEVRSLSAVSGVYDMAATVEADTPAKIDAAIDRIGRAHGVARTVSSIILSEKFAR